MGLENMKIASTCSLRPLCTASVTGAAGSAANNGARAGPDAPSANGRSQQRPTAHEPRLSPTTGANGTRTGTGLPDWPRAAGANGARAGLAANGRVNGALVEPAGPACESVADDRGQRRAG